MPIVALTIRDVFPHWRTNDAISERKKLSLSANNLQKLPVNETNAVCKNVNRIVHRHHILPRVRRNVLWNEHRAARQKLAKGRDDFLPVIVHDEERNVSPPFQSSVEKTDF